MELPMKPISLTNTLLASFIILSANVGVNQPSFAHPEPKFYCHTSGNKPVTVYINHRGIEEPWIRWTSNFFKKAGYDPLTRCQDVSHRLQIYSRHGTLRYVTTGRLNRQNVICTADSFNGGCKSLILTLEPGQDPVQTLKNLFAWHPGARPSEIGKNGVPYINVRGRLGGSVNKQ